MENQKFGFIDYDAKKQLKITCSQYLYLYAVSKMDTLEKYNMWCIANNEYFADLLDISVRGIQKMTKAMIEKGLLRKGKGSQKRVTDKFRLALLNTNKVHPKHEQSSPLNTNKVHPKHEQSSPYNNSIEIDNINSIKEKNTKKKSPTFFQQSNISTLTAFTDYFKSLEKFKDFDHEHYYKKIDMWGSTNKKVNWKKTAQNFMINDKQPKLTKVTPPQGTFKKQNYFR